jgi:transcriptional regulator with XRE-family HTH domain
MSQLALGRGIGVSFQAAQKYEQGNIRLSASRLFRAATFLELPVSFFFEPLEAPVIEAAGVSLASDEIQLVRSFRKIADARVRNEILQFIKQIAPADISDDQKRKASGC